MFNSFVNPAAALFCPPLGEQRCFARTRSGESLTLIWQLQSGEGRAVGAVLIPRSCRHRHGNLGCPDDAPNSSLGLRHRSAALRIPPPSFPTLIHKNPVFFILPFPFLPVHGTSRSILINRNSWNTFICSFPYRDIKIPRIQPDKKIQEVTPNMLIFFTGGLHFFHHSWWEEEKIYP